jgi:hypothetical protein
MLEGRISATHCREVSADVGLGESKESESVRTTGKGGMGHPASPGQVQFPWQLGTSSLLSWLCVPAAGDRDGGGSLSSI